MNRSKRLAWAKCALMCGLWNTVWAQPPGPPRQGTPPPTGAPLPGLSPSELARFQEGLRRFQEVVSVSGTEPATNGSGFGPRFNMNRCSGCHAAPAIGGSSPAANPQVAVATEYGALNTIPSFIQSNGPVRVARFIHASDGSADGGVHSLFTVTGRLDAGTCSIAQPDFATALAQDNVSFRIPTPVFGAGLIEAIPDRTILANKAANSVAKQALGIAGHENRSANDGGITRFGWKAQTRSLEIFSGEAYNVEMGVTNELFGSERDTTPGCSPNPLPEDRTNFDATSPVAAMSDIAAFSEFMRWLAPPQPQAGNASTAQGQQIFNQIGCALCHTPVLNTGQTASLALSNRPVVLFSDLLVHHMGTGLADGIGQGNAAADEFRSAPLWGLGQRIFLLHDGRTPDLVEAIKAHASDGSEANAVVAAFSNLPDAALQDLLAFLRSL
ncbi:MAG: thiol oxidoreductase [Acidobacteriia bacterium]|nr:thiol oxidoreductase [Terriglobia bacterium]